MPDTLAALGRELSEIKGSLQGYASDSELSVLSDKFSNKLTELDTKFSGMPTRAEFDLLSNRVSQMSVKVDTFWKLFLGGAGVAVAAMVALIRESGVIG